MTGQKEPASFRDPAGYVFRSGGVLYRAVSPNYRGIYQRLIKSGLYQELAAEGLLVLHDEVAEPGNLVDQKDWLVLRPTELPFVTYPHEWAPGQLHAAALLTLEIQRRALAHEMVLKDASPYNIAFVGRRPVFIDTLSFEPYVDGEPWVAYHQFCSAFLAPLALAKYLDPRALRLLGHYHNGIPLDLASVSLPGKTWLFPRLLAHIHVHARAASGRHAVPSPGNGSSRRVSRRALLGLLDNLSGLVRDMAWRATETPWANYSDIHGYSPGALEATRQAVVQAISSIRPGLVWDMGANTGTYSRLAASNARCVLAMDSDYGAIERLYCDLSGREAEVVHPMVIDFANPSPGLGWAHTERRSLLQRGPADLAMALALVHHLAFSAGVPLDQQALFFHHAARRLLVEWVPPTDPQVARLVGSRRALLDRYSEEEFLRALTVHFCLDRRWPLADSGRSLLFLTAR